MGPDLMERMQAQVGTGTSAFAVIWGLREDLLMGGQQARRGETPTCQDLVAGLCQTCIQGSGMVQPHLIHCLHLPTLASTTVQAFTSRVTRNLWHVQAERWGAKLFTEDVEEVDFRNRPFTIRSSDQTVRSSLRICCPSPCPQPYIHIKHVCQLLISASASLAWGSWVPELCCLQRPETGGWGAGGLSARLPRVFVDVLLPPKPFKAWQSHHIHLKRPKTRPKFPKPNSGIPITHCLVQVRAHSVVVATGATARKLGIPNEGQFWSSGISACAICDGTPLPSPIGAMMPLELGVWMLDHPPFWGAGDWSGTISLCGHCWNLRSRLQGSSCGLHMHASSLCDWICVPHPDLSEMRSAGFHWFGLTVLGLKGCCQGSHMLV